MSFAKLSDHDWWYLDSHAPRESASTARIYWLAGLYEGEGSVAGRTHIKVTQKERWVLDQVHHYFGGRVGGPYLRKNAVNGPTWVYEWYATGARGRGIAMTIYGLLSPRRQRQIRSFLNVPRDGDDPEWDETLRRIMAKLDARP